jgi:PAS domain S-box-containing protein
VPPETAPTRVAVLPPVAAGHPVGRAVEAAGARLVDRLEDATVVLVDLTSEAGEGALEAYRRAFPGQERAVLALVEEITAEQVEALDLPEFVTPQGLQGELPARLRKAQRRHRARMEARQHQSQLQNLLHLTSEFAASLDVVALLHDVTRRLAQDLGVERAALVALDEQREAGFIIAASDDAQLRGLRIDLSRYPEIREVVRTGKPVIVEDAPHHPLLEDVKAHVAGKGIHTIAALPLAVSGKLLGVLLLRTSAQRKAFTDRELDFLRIVAHATAVALRNVRLLETERGLTEREKLARIVAEERAADLARYADYFGHVSDGVAILDPSGRVLSLNPAGAALLDVVDRDVGGTHINALTNPVDETPLMELLCGTGEPAELAVRTGAGRRLTLSVTAAPLVQGGAATILSFRDVTEQRRLGDELRQTKEFLERLIDSSVDAIIAADLRGRVIVFNKGAEAICGWTAAEAKAQLNVRQLYPDGMARDLMRRLREDPRGQISLLRQEIVTRQGERVPVNMTASIVYEGSREVATVGIFTDLRDRMELEQKLSSAEERLEESERNAVIVALAGTAAHELNQPLTSVMGYAELLKRRLNEADYAFRPVDIIYREAERMAEIVRKIGKITRYETKSYVGQARILDLDKASSHED